MAYTYTVDIAAPVEKAFGMVDDPEKLKLWMEGLEETQYLSEYDPQHPVGVTFKQKIREGGRLAEYDGEVTAYAKPTHLGVRVGNNYFSVQVDYRFTPMATGTRLDYRCEFTAAAWYIRIMMVLFGWFTKRILKKQMTKLKKVAEQAEPALRKTTA